MTEFETAVKGFPLVAWLSRHAKFRDVGGDDIRINCPVCGRRKTLGINRHTKLAQCFACKEGYGGGWSGRANLVGLVKLFEKIDDRQAVAFIFREAGVAFQPEQRTEKSAPTLFYPEESVELAKANPAHPAVQYLHRRHVSHLIPSSRVCIDGRYSHRIILECQRFGAVHGFEAKAYGGQTPKSLYPDWMDTGHEFYTTRAWDLSANFAVLTESLLDAETFAINAIGLYGSTLRDGQLVNLLELRKQGITRLLWCLDQDAWRKQGKSILSKTSLFFENLTVDLPKGSDPNELGHAVCWGLVRTAREASEPADYLFRKMSELR